MTEKEKTRSPVVDSGASIQIKAEEDEGPDPKFTVDEIISGCKVFVNKEDGKRLAEILQQNTKKGKKVFYVHYQDYNKRLDEWISPDKIDFSKSMIPPVEKEEKKPEKSKSKTGTKTGKTTRASDKEESATPLENDEMDLDNLNVQGLKRPGEEVSREDEIKKLRTSGSMIQNHSEVARVRNLSSVILGEHIIEPWYFSPYPIELTEEDEIFICDFTLSYFGSKKQFERHRAKCSMKHPPGNEIYRDEKVSFWEIDGRKQRTWCRNLCLLSKLFLDHKTLYYDVDPFLFYIMTIRSPQGHHVVGYFSKEKESADGYNVACILTLPCYQKKGYGKLLIQFSYMLSNVENKAGSPEKPLSDLGLLSYRAFWTDVLVKLLVEKCNPHLYKKNNQRESSSREDSASPPPRANGAAATAGHGASEITIEEISAITCMTTTDVLHTLSTLQIIKYHKGQHIIVITDQIMALYDKLVKKVKEKKKHELDPEKLQWTPPSFTANQLRFGW
ncbi:histone acetyltransferase ESA1 [Candidozyma duobushaemuli]|uniref:Histone acetyltransferase ESA1 n=1 Tax=Candidozyma duobushaemuli TaxID=1231522 RepID=A0A2V1AH15_9ASCO|nr:histone acetyltransferase ESA1 [[Candida] duobushaemulonis]PVH16866.1 histone acetyltransferase ESA1 [[Candida] duobushaemulonis]